jgi:small subunit ribosomal protein S1
VKTVQSKVEKATLGDLGVLADLKKKMDSGATEESATEETKPE